LLLVPGAEIAVLPSMTHLASGCLVQRLDRAIVECDAERWLDAVEKQLIDLSAVLARLYLDSEMPRLIPVLRRHGYQRVEELGLVAPAQIGAHGRGGASLPRAPVAALAFADASGWERRRDLYRRLPVAPDGFACCADDWVGMEQTRVAVGYMEPFEIRWQDRPCGAVNLNTANAIVRVKNLAIHPDMQGRGVATAAASLFRELAFTRGCPWVGVYAVRGSPSERLYRRAGFEPILSRQGWTRRLCDSE
jgi:GNAT superfamily N-acetyltransferase